MAKRSTVTVGTFDGVHLGHQEVLDELVQVASERGDRSVLVSFDPHPLKIVRPADAPRLLTTPKEKEAIIAQYGIDLVSHLPFTRELSEYPPERFVTEILVGRFGMAHLVIGYDHGFGKGRSGDVETLRAIGARLGFEVDVVEPLQMDGENVSSSKIRAMLMAGDVRRATRALGRPYSLWGTVVRGEGIGGPGLGMPTANIEIREEDKLLPMDGIYAVKANGMDGVAHLGPRPTFTGVSATIEVHLLDFSGDLYGKTLTLEFIERIRGIEKFGSMGALAEAMREDASEARRILQGGREGRGG